MNQAGSATLKLAVFLNNVNSLNLVAFYLLHNIKFKTKISIF